MEAKESPLGLYLYCLARASLLHNLAGPGLDGENSLAVLSFGDIAAIWSPVSLHDFCGKGAAASLQDLAWVGPRACRHEEVVEQVMRLSPVLPARFGTIFSSPDKLERLLRQHHGRIDAFLDRVRGQEEWALKGLLDRARARGEFLQLQLTAAADRLAALSPGKRYFQEQRLRGRADQEPHHWLREVGRELVQALGQFAPTLQERGLRPGVGAGNGRELIFNWAVMLPREAVPGLKAYLEAANARHGRRGLSFTCSGPWPPYSFTPALALEAET